MVLVSWKIVLELWHVSPVLTLVKTTWRPRWPASCKAWPRTSPFWAWTSARTWPTSRRSTSPASWRPSSASFTTRIRPCPSWTCQTANWNRRSTMWLTPWGPIKVFKLWTFPGTWWGTWGQGCWPRPCRSTPGYELSIWIEMEFLFKDTLTSHMLWIQIIPWGIFPFQRMTFKVSLKLIQIVLMP